MMGNQTCSRRSSEYFPLKVLESYLSYGMSAALFKLFREKHGITYDLGVYYPIRSGNAPFLIYLSVSNDQALFAFELLSKLWKNLLNNPLTDAEIFLAKEKLKGSFLLGNQSLDEIGEILSIKSPDTVEVKFRRGSFLIDIDKIEKS